jgi:hypothetical protein
MNTDMTYIKLIHTRYFKPIQTYPRVDLVLNFCFMEVAQRSGLIIANKIPQ